MAVTVSNNTGDTVANPMARAFREAIYAGLVAFGLFVLLIGLRTDQNIRNELVLIQRWGLLAIVVGITALGRFLYVAFAIPAMERAKAEKAAAPAAAAEPGFVRRNFNSLGIAALVLYPILVVSLVGFQSSLKWVDNFGIQILIYVMLAWGLNIVVGLAGLLDLGYVAFYAVGAYAYALLGTHYGLSFWILLPAAGIMAAFWGILLGFPVLRLRGDYLAIVTLAFGEIIRLVLINWREVTNGAAGISGIPKVSFFGLMSFNVSDPNYIAKVLGIAQSGAYYKIFLYYLILAMALVTAFVTIRLRRMPVGRAGKPCARMRSPAAHSASTPPPPSSRRLPPVQCSAVSPAPSSPPGKASYRRNPLSSSNRPSSWRSWCWVAWVRSAASRSLRS